ncbi:MAG TPA: GAF domain-containing protein, partial [Anaerolineales bacterium]|nr:GAF domain-containing protein [Anaerolineales bacterium]
SIFIALYDKSSGLVSWPYWVTNGERVPDSIEPLKKNITRRVLFATAPLNLGTEQEILDHDAIAPEGYTSVGKSFLGVPFSVGNAMLGALSIHAVEQEHAFAESDERLLQTIANVMSVALENARLFDETQRLFKAEQERVAELQIINSIQQGLAAELDFQAIVDLVGDKLREVFKTPDLSIDWYDEKANLLHYLYAYEHGERLNIPPRPPAAGGVFESMIKTRQPVVLNNAEDYAKLNFTTLPGTDQSKSAVSLPIISSDRVLGIIGIENYERENAFGESELRLLTTIAASLGTALENARLFDETQRLFKAEQERVAELQIINSIQQGLAAELDFQAIVDLVGDKLREVLSTGDMGIYWADEKNKVVQPLYVYEHGKRLTTPPFPLTEKHLVRQEPKVYNTIAEQLAAGVTTTPGTDQCISSIQVQIIGSDRVLGALILEDHERENAYGESEIRLLTTIAASLGTALENARLFDETQRLFKAEQERVAELQIINSIQQGLAAELDFQAIIDLVGDKLSEVLNAGDLGITWYDEKNNLMRYLYTYEHGERIEIPPRPPQPGGQFETMRKTRQPFVMNTVADYEKMGLLILPGTDPSKSMASIPIISSDRLLGTLSIENYERENAYGDSELRLLTTIAASLGTALENARLF